MRRYSRLIWGALYFSALAYLFLLIEDMPAYDRAVFFDLVTGIVIPFILAAIVLLAIGLISIGLIGAALIYIYDRALDSNR